MRRIISVILGILVMLLTSSMAQAQPQWEIVPGVSAGPIKLGMSIEQIEAILHRDPKADQSIFHGRPIWIFYKEGIQVNYDIKQKAMQIYVDKPGILAKGVQVGDPSNKFLPVFGNDYIAHELPTAQCMPNQYHYAYRRQGIGFQIEGDHIKFIFICRPLNK